MAVISVVVRGRVQGVGFRSFVQREAIRRGLAGEVWNRRDGAVEMRAQGPADTLEEFCYALVRGPGRVDSLDAEPIEEPGEWASFDIVAGRG